MSWTRSQEQIIKHIAQHRLSTVEAIHALFYAGKTPDAARKAAERLKEEGWLASFGVQGKVFYYLTAEAAGRVGVPRSAADTPGAQALFERYAVLAFCCLLPTRRQLLSPHEFETAFPELAALPGISAAHQHYYLDEHEGTTRLGRALTDSGAATERVIRKCRDFVRKHRSQPAFRLLLEEDLFVITILTPEQTKREALLNALLENPLGVPVRVMWIPELARLL